MLIGETQTKWFSLCFTAFVLVSTSCAAAPAPARTPSPPSIAPIAPSSGQPTQNMPDIQLTPLSGAPQPPSAERQCTGVVVRPFAKNSETGQYDESVLQGLDTKKFKLGDPVVVYYKEPSGIEFPAAVLKVVEINLRENAMIGKLVFLRPGVDAVLLGTLAGLCVDRNISTVNLERLAPVGRTFIGFILPDEFRIRIRPDTKLNVGDEVRIARISKGGNAVVDENTSLVITAIENEATARVTHTLASWANNVGELLVYSTQTLDITFEVKDYVKTTVCVSVGDKVEVHASGRIYAGQFVKDLGPEGKEKMLNVVPLDPSLDIVPAFPHGALMIRIEPADKELAQDEAWLSYTTNRTFVADKSGCLALNMNDKQKTDNSGQFDVEITVQR